MLKWLDTTGILGDQSSLCLLAA